MTLKLCYESWNFKLSLVEKSPDCQALAKREHSITRILQLADVSIDRLLHHGKARWLNCPDEVFRSGTLKKYPVSPRIGKKMTPGTMHLFGKNNDMQEVHIAFCISEKKTGQNSGWPACLITLCHYILTDRRCKMANQWTKTLKYKGGLRYDPEEPFWW